MDEKLPYMLLLRKSSNEPYGYGYYRRQRFNYRYPIRGRKPSSKSALIFSFARFNYRYPVRGRKLKLIGNFVALATDLITVIEIGNRALTKLSMRGESFSWLRI